MIGTDLAFVEQVVYTSWVLRADHVEGYVRDLAERLGPGAVLPSERDLANTCGVSRMTVRRALDELDARRLIERRHGAGTFVRQPAVAQPLMATSFQEDMRSRGLAPSSRLLATTNTTADPGLAARLEIDPGDPVLIVRRLRLADDEPIALETLHVPSARTPGLTGSAFAENSFYELLRTRFGYRIASGRQSVEPVVLTTAEAEPLAVTARSAAFRFERSSRNQHGQIVEFVHALYRPDRYRIEIDILPPAEDLR